MNEVNEELFRPLPEEPQPDPAEKSSTPENTPDGSTLTDGPAIPTQEMQDNWKAAVEVARNRAARLRAKYYGQEQDGYKPVKVEARTEDAEAYLRRMSGQPQAPSREHRLSAILGRIEAGRRWIRPQEIGFNDASVIIRRIYQADLTAQEREFSLQPGVGEIFEDIIRYFIGDPESPIPLTKGLFLYGANGVGKSYMLKMFKRFCDVIPIPQMQFQIAQTKEILQAVSDASNLKALNPYKSGGLLLDDLGEEKALKKIYGEAENPMDMLISARYERFIDHGTLTHFTSNLVPEELTRYGTRIYERLNEMTTFISVPGRSYRFDDPVDFEDLPHDPETEKEN
ncbi:hypothetical protein [Arsenicibacter rosenii]|nr:hypothetical protein [Arsenicibacter rosenii]